MNRDWILVIISVVCSLLMYGVYTQRQAEQTILNNRSVQVIKGTGAPGKDATSTTLIPGPSGRDGILKQSDPSTLKHYQNILSQHWASQRVFQKHLLLLSVFVGCVLAGNTAVLWYAENLSMVFVVLIGFAAVLWGVFIWLYMDPEKYESYHIPPSYPSDTNEERSYYQTILEGSDYYQALGFVDVDPSTVTDSMIRTAYKKRMLKYHSDKSGPACVATTAIEKVRRDEQGTCFLRLKDPVRTLFPDPSDTIVVEGINNGNRVFNTSTNPVPFQYTDDPYVLSYQSSRPVIKIDEEPLQSSSPKISRGGCLKYTEAFTAVLNTAHSTLTDPGKRQVYDSIRKRFRVVPLVIPPNVSA